MHYRNGREAKVGDRIVALNSGKPIAGILIEASAGSTTCNGRVLGEPAISNASYVTLSDCIHADDIESKALAQA